MCVRACEYQEKSNILGRTIPSLGTHYPKARDASSQGLGLSTKRNADATKRCRYEMLGQLLPTYPVGEEYIIDGVYALFLGYEVFLE